MAAHIVCFAVVNVMLGTLAFVPVLLYAPTLRMASQGWGPMDAALFGAMLGSTDAVAVSAILKAGVREVGEGGTCFHLDCTIPTRRCHYSHLQDKPPAVLQLVEAMHESSALLASRFPRACATQSVSARACVLLSPPPPLHASPPPSQVVPLRCCRLCWSVSHSSMMHHPLCSLRCGGRTVV